MSTLMFLAGFLVICFLINVCLLKLCARLGKAPPLGFCRAVVILVVLFSVNWLFWGIIWWFWWLEEQADQPSLVLAVAQLLIGLCGWLLLWFLLAWGLRTTRSRALLIGISWYLLSFLVILGIALFLIPWVVPFYVIPTNSMAPTLVGTHKASECPKCGGKLVVPYNPMFPEDLEREEVLGICQDCFKISKVNQWHPKVLTSDRFACNRWLSPRRWDVVVFRYPIDPERKYVMRLVGLPGEELVIQNKEIWINGVKEPLPQELGGLEYVSTTWDLEDLNKWEGDCWGSPTNPAKLGEKEYFVLGDFTRRSSDSRFWKTVPEANLEGVASLIYWPPSRLRILR